MDRYLNLEKIGRVLWYVMPNEKISKIIHGRVNIQVGKNGINAGLIEQVKNQFKHQQYLKIRFLDLHLFGTTEEAAHHLAQVTRSKVVDIRGNTTVLQRNSSNN